MTEAGSAGNIGNWLTDNAERLPGRTALKPEDGDGWTYKELDGWVDAIAVMLRAGHGVARGDRVAYLGLNHPAMVVLLFACARLGAVLVPLNWRLTAHELAYMVADCEPKVLYFDDAHEENAEFAADAADNCILQSIQSLEAANVRPESTQTGGALSDPVLIVYTSGTTGRPKGAILTQQALLTNARNSIALHRLTSDDRVLVVLPLFHVGGLNISLTPALMAGAQVELHSRFEAAKTLAAIETFKPQILVLVPATMTAIMNSPAWNIADTSSLRMLTTGSMVVPVGLIATFEVKGIPVVQVYGSTETSPIAAYTRPGDGRTNPHTTGKAAVHTQVRIVDGEGEPYAEPNIAGEIEICGANVMNGYWMQPEETADAFNGDWHRTGDIGHLDEAGNLYFHERIKHVIMSGGENIYPAEIERVISAIPGVAEVAVCGIADEKWGEVPAAGIVLSSGAEEVSKDDIHQVLEAELAHFKHPKVLSFLAELPRNAMGKVVHDELRSALVGK
ncbi:MAG: AMP-binding protein [Rhizobiales bacterium]|nr:AMP-binding protein [Hyphomicrobiales bacterium]